MDGTYYHGKELMTEVSGVSIPLFEAVYRDAEALYGKYGYDILKSADYVLYHISIGRTLNYHEVPLHLYWKAPPSEPTQAGVEAGKGLDSLAVFTRAEHGWAEGLHPFDRFVKNTYEVLSPLNELTAQMLLPEYCARNG